MENLGPDRLAWEEGLRREEAAVQAKQLAEGLSQTPPSGSLWVALGLPSTSEEAIVFWVNPNP